MLSETFNPNTPSAHRRVAQSTGGGYVVSVSNEPKPGAGAHDDFELYYGAVTGVGAQEHFILHLNKIELSLDAPCMSGTVDGDGRGY